MKKLTAKSLVQRMTENPKASGLTIYVRPENKDAIQKAKKLLAWHRNQSLSEFVIAELKKIIEQYEGQND